MTTIWGVMTTGLAVWRRGLGWSQARAAETLGLNRVGYAQLEVGRLRPSRLQLEKLTAYFGDADLVQKMLEPIPPLKIEQPA
ncbi:MAG TPA: helix-turn-helix transcriptional regulator [Candidatus Cybelea sp.]